MSVADNDFDALYTARAAGMVRSIYVRTGDIERSRECVQEAFTRAWMRWSKIREKNPAAWVRTVAWNLAVSDWRMTVREQTRWRESSRLNHRQGKPAEELIAIRQSLLALSEDERTVVVLHYFEDMPVAEIARLIAMPVGTVKSHLHRARATLRLALSDPPDTVDQTPSSGRTEPLA